jgi:hypothetical protein
MQMYQNSLKKKTGRPSLEINAKPYRKQDGAHFACPAAPSFANFTSIPLLAPWRCRKGKALTGNLMKVQYPASHAEKGLCWFFFMVCRKPPFFPEDRGFSLLIPPSRGINCSRRMARPGQRPQVGEPAGRSYQEAYLEKVIEQFPLPVVARAEGRGAEVLIVHRCCFRCLQNNCRGLAAQLFLALRPAGIRQQPVTRGQRGPSAPEKQQKTPSFRMGFSAINIHLNKT